MPLSLRNSIVFEFTLFLPRIRFNVIGFEPSKILSLKLSRLTQSVKRCFTAIVWLWHSSHSGGTARLSSLYPWDSNVWLASSESVDNSFILSTSIVFFPWPGVWFNFFEFFVLLIPLCVTFHMYDIINIWKQVLIGEWYQFFLSSWCFFGFFICVFVSGNTCVSSTVH